MLTVRLLFYVYTEGLLDGPGVQRTYHFGGLAEALMCLSTFTNHPTSADRLYEVGRRRLVLPWHRVDGRESMDQPAHGTYFAIGGVESGGFLPRVTRHLLRQSPKGRYLHDAVRFVRHVVEPVVVRVIFDQCQDGAATARFSGTYRFPSPMAALEAFAAIGQGREPLVDSLGLGPHSRLPLPQEATDIDGESFRPVWRNVPADSDGVRRRCTNNPLVGTYTIVREVSVLN